MDRVLKYVLCIRPVSCAYVLLCFVLLCFFAFEDCAFVFCVYPVVDVLSHLLSCLRRSRPGDETHALITKAFNDRGKKEMFHDYVMAITERVKVAPCHQNG